MNPLHRHLIVLTHPDPLALADDAPAILGASAVLIDDPDAVRAFRGDARWTCVLEAALDLMDLAKADASDLAAGSRVVHARKHGGRTVAWLSDVANSAPVAVDFGCAVYAP
jgi:hypothetical protein